MNMVACQNQVSAVKIASVYSEVWQYVHVKNLQFFTISYFDMIERLGKMER